jgi:uncharacterized protein (TIGR00251 family)
MNTIFDQLKSQLAAKSPLYIRVKVITKSPKTEIVEQMVRRSSDSSGDDVTYKIRVHAVPEKGAANEELCKFLRKSLGASEVSVVSGGRDKMKLIRISA